MTRRVARMQEDVPYTGFIIVRLQPAYAGLSGSTLHDAALTPILAQKAPAPSTQRAPVLPRLAEFLEHHELTRSMRLIITSTPEHVAELEAMARELNVLPPERSLRQYWRLDARDLNLSTEAVERLLHELREIAGVSSARIETPLSLPTAVTPEGDPRYNQFYLRAPSDGGVNAEALWDLGYDGTGAGFVDIEGGWFLQHTDLPTTKLALPSDETMNLSETPHGTNVLGIVASADNGGGVVGIAPGVSDITLCSIYRTKCGTKVTFLHDAIVRAIDKSSVGDVILIEWQAIETEGCLPVEVNDDVYDAIRLAVALGRVVIEPAGNGTRTSPAYGIKLDDINRYGVAVLARGVRESGAIMIAASMMGPNYTPRDDSNYGTRVDCFAPGEKIATCDYDWSKPNYPTQSTFRANFAHTSAASAIVAGAAVLLQSAWIARTGNPLAPLPLRSRFSDPALNQAQGASTHCIGYMPNLGTIIDVVLPDVYLRDSVTDDGVVPSAGALSASPDIIVRQASVGNPTAAFGEISGTSAVVALSDDVRVGADHYVYTRVRNRGGLPALGTTVDVYWSPPATLITPGAWNRIGTTAPFDVPVGDTLAVSPELVWPVAALPPAGHYCFIAVANHPGDQVLLPLASDWDGFVELVRNSNNVTWRNFQVVDYAKIADLEWLRIPFIIRGAPDQIRIFRIQFEAQFLTAGKLWLDLPETITNQLCQSRVPIVAESEVQDAMREAPGQRRGRAMIDLAVEAGLRPRPLLLDPGVDYECALAIRAPILTAPYAGKVVVKQFFNALEVGRLTWSFP